MDPSHLASTPVRKIVAELDDDQQQLVECASEFCVGNMLFVSWNTEGDEVFFGRREGPNLADTSVYSWSPYSGEVRIVRGIDDEWIEECQPSEDSLVCIRQTPTEPAHLISIDYKTGDVVTIFDPNPEFKDLIKGDVKRIAWSNGWTDWGDDVIGHLVYPLNYDTERSYPLVVVQYRSRGFLRGGVGDEYPILPLSAAGFAVLSIDRPNPWKLFETLTGRDLGAALFASAKDNDWDRALENVMNGIEAIDSEIRIDKERMAIVGLSDGTVSTLNALMNTDFFTIGIISSNSWDPIGYYLAGVNWKTTLKTIGFEYPATGSLEHWQRISPALNAEKIDAPLLLNLPQSEFLVSTQFLSALQSFERPHEAYVYPDEYHIKWQPIHRYVIYRRNVQWLQFWLLDHEAVDPVDRKQYVRWRKIREDACVNGEGNEQDRPGFCQ